MGDFNDIVHQSEKQGAASRNEKQMEMFRNALEDCQLCDLGFQGPISRGVINGVTILSQKNVLIERWLIRSGVIDIVQLRFLFWRQSVLTTSLYG